mgnify:CR=1 FL=1
MSTYGNYEQILYEWLTNFVDADSDDNPLVFRNNPPSMEEVQAFGDKVYCVYSVFEGAFGNQVAQPVSLFCYGSQAKVFAKKELMSQALLNNAVVISGDDIKVKLTSGNPFVQDRTDADKNVKGYYINILATVYKL